MNRVHPKHFYSYLPPFLTVPVEPDGWLERWRRRHTCRKAGGHWWHWNASGSGCFCCQCGKKHEEYEAILHPLPEDGTR